MNFDGQPLYHVTTLSNFARAYDKYTRQYRKSCIPESRYPLESYLLPAAELAVGVAKACRLRDKLKIPGDRLLVLQAAVERSRVQPNLRNGLGFVWPSADLPVSGVFQVGFRRHARTEHWSRRGDGQIAGAKRRTVRSLRCAKAPVRFISADRTWLPGCVPVLLFRGVRICRSSLRCAGYSSSPEVG